MKMIYMMLIKRAVEDLNPRHQVLETCVLPTELTAQGDEPLDHHKRDGIGLNEA